jgi:hypothetical protein
MQDLAEWIVLVVSGQVGMGDWASETLASDRQYLSDLSSNISVKCCKQIRSEHP